MGPCSSRDLVHGQEVKYLQLGGRVDCWVPGNKALVAKWTYMYIYTAHKSPGQVLCTICTNNEAWRKICTKSPESARTEDRATNNWWTDVLPHCICGGRHLQLFTGGAVGQVCPTGLLFPTSPPCLLSSIVARMRRAVATQNSSDLIFQKPSQIPESSHSKLQSISDTIPVPPCNLIMREASV